MRYFNLFMTLESAQMHFKELSLKLHPDKGGDNLLFAEMKNEYDEFKTIKKHWSELHRYFFSTMNPKQKIIYIEREPQLEKIVNQAENIFNVGNSVIKTLSKWFEVPPTSVNTDE